MMMKTEKTAEALLRQIVRRQIENGSIQTRKFSDDFGICDVSVSSDLFAEKEMILAIDRDAWDESPTEALTERLIQMLKSGEKNIAE